MTWKRIHAAEMTRRVHEELRFFFDERLLSRREGLLKEMPDNVTIAFHLTGDGGGEWTVEICAGLRVREGASAWPDCRLECDADRFAEIIRGECEVKAAYLAGELMVQGDVGLLFTMGKGLLEAEASERELV